MPQRSEDSKNIAIKHYLNSDKTQNHQNYFKYVYRRDITKIKKKNVSNRRKQSKIYKK